jgi:hypothetical protein
MVIRHWFFCLVCLIFSLRPSGVARQPVTFCIRYAHPTGRLAGAQQTTLSTAKKSNQKMP